MSPVTRTLPVLNDLAAVAKVADAAIDESRKAEPLDDGLHPLDGVSG